VELTDNLGRIMLERVEARGSQVAISVPGRALDGATCAREIRRFAGALVKAGVHPGDRVAVMLPNIPEFPIANVGVWLAGGVYLPLNIMLGPADLAILLDDAQPSVCIVADELDAAVKEEIAARVPRVVAVGADGPDGWDAFLSEGEGVVAPAPAVEVATLAYTSGTTGVPKGALIAPDQIDLSEEVIRDRYGLGPDDVVMQVLPFFHSNASLSGVVLAWWLGARAAMLPRFSVEGLAELVERERVTFGACVPTVMYDVGASGAQQEKWRSMRYLLFGAMRLPAGVRERFEEATGVTTINSYGMTEAPNAVVCDTKTERAPGAVGHALPHVQIVALDDEGEPVATGTVGELAIEPRHDGPYARRYRPLTGYRGRPDATREAVHRGRFRTGDLGIVAEDGTVHLVDRKKDMISCAGYKIYPAELEATLTQDSRIAEAYVVGTPEPRRGEVAVAFVVAADGVPLSAAEVMELSREQLAAYKRLAGVQICRSEELPRSSLGKVLKRELDGSVLLPEAAAQS
jgi:long-chain acyl-CoA synthetase